MKHETDFNDDSGEGEGGALLKHIPSILWQRKWLLIVPAILLTIAGIAAAFLMPVTYRSTATLLVRSSALPTDVAGATTSEIVDRRIARIRQQVLSRPGLIELINRYQLYPKDRADGALSAVIEDMREAISIESQAAAVQQGSNSSTIAFTLSYDYAEPAKAQAVVQDLVEQVLQLDSQGNTEQAASTVQFLTDQSRSLEEQAAGLERQIAGIKAANGGVLSGSTMAMMGGSGSYDVQIAALQRENSQLLSQREVVRESAPRDPVVAAAEAQLAGAQAVYSDNHPDVRLARQRLEEARSLAKRNVEKIPTQQIDQQLAFNNSQIAQLRAAQSSDSARVSASMGAAARAPLVMEQVNQLQQRLDALNSQRRGVSDRLLQARAGARAESEQLGERLSVSDPPVVPDEPVSPNRLVLGGGGIAAGLMLGLLLVAAVEFIKRPIRDPSSLVGLFGDVPLGVVPTIKPKLGDGAGGKRRWFRLGRRTARA